MNVPGIEFGDANIRGYTKRKSIAPAKRGPLDKVKEDLLAERPPSPEEPSRVGETIATVIVAGSPRRIRLDTHEAPADDLNAFIRGVREGQLTARNRSLSHQAKMAAVSKEVGRLRIQCLECDFEDSHLGSRTWRQVIKNKQAPRPEDELRFVPPQNRLKMLREVERQAYLEPTVRSLDKTNANFRWSVSSSCPNKGPLRKRGVQSMRHRPNGAMTATV